jgi:hypothetical protein
VSWCTRRTPSHRCSVCSARCPDGSHGLSGAEAWVSAQSNSKLETNVPSSWLSENRGLTRSFSSRWKEPKNVYRSLWNVNNVPALVRYQRVNGEVVETGRLIEGQILDKVKLQSFISWSVESDQSFFYVMPSWYFDNSRYFHFLRSCDERTLVGNTPCK